MRRMSFLVLSVALMSSLVALADDATAPPPPAEGGSVFRQPGGLLDRSPQRRSQELSFFLGLPYDYFYYGFGVGVGARYYIPILHDGFIPAVNDEFGIEFGADFTAAFGGYFLPVIDIPVEVMWNFHFTPKFSAYAKVGIALELSIYSNAYLTYSAGTHVGVIPVSGVGLHYKLSDSVNLRVEVGYPWVKVGLGFNL